ALGGDRFRREIEVVARLHHPHILPLHDSGEVDGLLYYVMPLVTGETLSDRIAREGRLPVSDVRRVVNDVAAALDYAHRRGVVHRDVKPANILLDDEHATIADFGIAHRALDDSADQLTTVGMVIGTPTYMSPEQSTGSREVDARTDIYALGCVVFEMLTGTPPFRARNAAGLVAQHIQAPVPSAHELRPEVPPAIDEVLRTALAKDPADRFASARDFAAAVGVALDSSGTARVVPMARTQVREPSAVDTNRGRRIAIGLGAGVILAAGAFAASRMGASRAEAIPSIAVLPFANMSDSRDTEYFSDGITEELTGALAQIGRFRVTPRTTAFVYKGRAGDIRRIARELRVRYIVEGSVRRGGDAVRIAAVLHDVESGNRLLDEKYDRQFSSWLPLQTSIAAAIAERLQQRLLPADSAKLSRRHTVDPEAYDNYLKGRSFFDQRTAPSLAQALDHFQRAIEIDPRYARAHAGLADTYSILAWNGYAAPAELFARARESALRAKSLDSTLAETHVSLGIIRGFHDWQWAAADSETSLAIRKDSSLARAWYFRTWHLFAGGRYDSAMSSLRRASQLDPLSPVTGARIGSLYYFARDYRAADSVARAILKESPNAQLARLLRARVLSAMGQHDSAIAALPADTVRFGGYEAGVAGYVYARAGRRDAALAAARALEERPYVPGEGMAAIYAGLGDVEQALRWLNAAVESRGILITLAREPMYDTLRADPRFERILERIGLERRSTTQRRQ
ncbi:MAG TPA: protein kinase, partial [Gemmatimonadaceae bacterium]|nr:protein kinase [Gemmatimonadaceae bacterium]